MGYLTDADLSKIQSRMLELKNGGAEIMVTGIHYRGCGDGSCAQSCAGGCGKDCSAFFSECVLSV